MAKSFSPLGDEGVTMMAGSGAFSSTKGSARSEKVLNYWTNDIVFKATTHREGQESKYSPNVVVDGSDEVLYHHDCGVCQRNYICLNCNLKHAPPERRMIRF